MKYKMKLRIRGNSLRLRLNRRDVERFIETGTVEESIRFGVGEHERLTYALESSAQAAVVAARFEGGRITVILPLYDALKWAQKSEQISFMGEQQFGAAMGAEPLKILIEKDFACLTKRDADALEG
ncbi:MAG: hypothetical protein WKF84_12830 [Pyrinomonadaceae bacterium]